MALSPLPSSPRAFGLCMSIFVLPAVHAGICCCCGAAGENRCGHITYFLRLVFDWLTVAQSRSQVHICIFILHHMYACDMARHLYRAGNFAYILRRRVLARHVTHRKEISVVCAPTPTLALPFSSQSRPGETTACGGKEKVYRRYGVARPQREWRRMCKRLSPKKDPKR